MSTKRQTPFKLGKGRMIAEEAPRRVFEVSVAVGPVTVHGLLLWRSRNGKLRVYWPSHRTVPPATYWRETVELDPELREQIELEVIAEYRKARKLTKGTERK